MSKAGKIVSKAGTVVLCLVLVLAIIFVVFQVFASTGRALPGGYRPLIVLSGSMKPVMPVGSVVVSKSVDAASVKVGDIVTYAQASDPTGKTSPFITHRVAKVIQGTSGLSFVTKGDANNTDDQNPVPASRIVGRVVLIMPSVGRVTQFVHSPLGLILLILLPGAILIAWEGIGLVNRRGKSAKAGGNTAAVLLVAIMGMGAVAMATGSSISGTEAYFVTASNSIGFSISTGTWGPTQPNLTLSPGTSTATRQDHCPVVFPIASQEPSGKLTLDFGELNPGDCTDWTDVFRIENAGAQDAHVNVGADGAIKPWISALTLGGNSPPATIAAGAQQAAAVAIKLQVPADTAPGNYAGTISVSTTDPSYSVDIHVTLTVLKGGGTTAQLALSPGDAKAVRKGRQPAAALIASQEANGKLRLDFGEVVPGNSNNSPDVFGVKNLGTQDVKVNVTASGAFKTFVGSIALGSGGGVPATVPAGAEQAVTIKLQVPKNAARHDYAGTIRVSTTDGSYSVDIPVIVTVAGTGGKSWLMPTQPGHQAIEPVTPDPGTGPTAPSPADPGTGPTAPSPADPGTGPAAPSPADPATKPVAPQLTLAPGVSKAARTGDSGDKSSFAIASVQSGTLRLDFGEVTAGNAKKWGSVFTIENGGVQDTQLTIVARGAFKRFVQRIRLGSDPSPAVLAAGDTSAVAIDLRIPAGAAPGDYSGTIRVTTADGLFSVDIPVTLTVVAKPPKADPPAVTPSSTGGADAGSQQAPAASAKPASGDQQPDPPASPQAASSGSGSSGGDSSPPAATSSG